MEDELRIDLFCRVVDNYGDIGVCWRLARRLAHGHHARLRLWVDDLASFSRIQPRVDIAAAQQAVDGIEVVRWDASAPDLVPGDLVIEAFACDPPPRFVERLRTMAPQPVWINLEYLSAETWVEDYHAMPSHRPDGTLKHFFFPGFSDRTGGLLREPGLIDARDAWRRDAAEQAGLLTRLGLLGRRPGERLATLFCYPDAPVDDLLAGLNRAPGDTLLAVPQGAAPRLAEGRHGAVTVARYALAPQADFDRLLWTADLNLVRGEDSFIRAHWAGQPMLWEIYPQDEDAHWVKLDAWLAHAGFPPEIDALNRAWNRMDPATRVADALAAALTAPLHDAWRSATTRFTEALAQQPDLADRLIEFVRNRARPAERIQ
jgi:uncharacterized repeat protein (TIGR03837 family)